ncbi:hypothetical protein C4573_02190 [Candidatus Woesearchaeota archaeon]|nr:MAG: hypothetical protein C4573_02190 [Candidatus Woesearchaeota archaeon]
MVKKPIRVQENKVVMAKLSREDFIKLQKHCTIKDESVNSVVKKAIMTEVDSPVPHMLAGKNLFVYNKNKDNFSWRVMLDNGLRVDIEEDISAEYVSQLFNSLKEAIDERETYIKKESTDAVAIPSKLVRKGL